METIKSDLKNSPSIPSFENAVYSGPKSTKVQPKAVEKKDFVA